MFGTALLYGDGLITPAISVLSAVEGFEVATTAFEDWVIPVSVVILVGLFTVQRRGTAGIAKVFGPVMVVWFAVIAVLGLRPDRAASRACSKAVWPGYAVGFFTNEPGKAFLALGSIFLVLTGGEALYADMGHFGLRPIRHVVVLLGAPGAAAQLLRAGGPAVGDDPSAIESPFYRLAPDWAITPLAILATMATVIASQALISGAFSLTAQAINLDYLPRLDGPAHFRRSRRADLRSARQLAVDDRLRRPRPRLPIVVRPCRRLRHRRDRDDDDHDAAVLPSRPRPVRLVDTEGDCSSCCRCCSST